MFYQVMIKSKAGDDGNLTKMLSGVGGNNTLLHE